MVVVLVGCSCFFTWSLSSRCYHLIDIVRVIAFKFSLTSWSLCLCCSCFLLEARVQGIIRNCLGYSCSFLTELDCATFASLFVVARIYGGDSRTFHPKLALDVLKRPGGRLNCRNLHHQSQIETPSIEHVRFRHRSQVSYLLDNGIFQNLDSFELFVNAHEQSQVWKTTPTKLNLNLYRPASDTYTETIDSLNLDRTPSQN